MSGNMNRRDFLRKAGLAAVCAAAAGHVAFAEDNAIYTPGEYTASAPGHGGGMVKVTVTFDETSITNVIVDASDQTESVGGPAAPILEQQVMKA